jgi:hypothetical protein
MKTVDLELPAESRLRSIWSVVPQLQSTAAELFDFVSVEIEADPEIPDSYYLVVRVRASGEISEIAARHLEWHRRTRHLLNGSLDLVRLDIDAQ